MYYTSFADGGATSTITRKPADGSGEAETLRDVKGRAYLGWVDRAQSSGVLHVVDPSSDRGDIMRVAFDGRSEPVPLSATSFNEYGAAVSPNGRWLAFNSDETGRPEVYVVELERPSVRRQVTRTGGEEPHWSGSGRELFYRQGNRMMAVSVGSSQAFEFGAARPLFDGTYTSGIESGRSYDADPTQPRFLLMLPDSSSSGAAAVRVVVNWNPLGRDGRPDRP